MIKSLPLAGGLFCYKKIIIRGEPYVKPNRKNLF
nr:MAG TPA: hypothetical protein [Caudoviricetes sp.]